MIMNRLSILIASLVDKTVIIKGYYDDFLVRYFEYVISYTEKILFAESGCDDLVDQELCSNVYFTTELCANI